MERVFLFICFVLMCCGGVLPGGRALSLSFKQDDSKIRKSNIAIVRNEISHYIVYCCPYYVFDTAIIIAIQKSQFSTIFSLPQRFITQKPFSIGFVSSQSCKGENHRFLLKHPVNIQHHRTFLPIQIASDQPNGIAFCFYIRLFECSFLVLLMDAILVLYIESLVLLIEDIRPLE